MKASRLTLALLIVVQLCIPITEGQQEDDSEEAPWWAAVSAYHFPHVFATDLEDFVPQLESSTADYVLIDFYAPWCPHCQHFAPDYERLALAVQKFDEAQAQANSPQKRSILSATVDCVRFAKTCDFWGVHSYPTIMWGERKEWIKKAQTQAQQQEDTDAKSAVEEEDGTEQATDQPPGVADPESAAAADKASSGIMSIDTWDGTADSVAAWINNRTKFGLNISAISRQEVATMLHQSQSSSSKGHVSKTKLSSAADVWDAQLGAALLLRDILQHHAFEDKDEEAQLRQTGSHHKKRRRTKPQAKSRNTTRAAFTDFVSLLAERFPESPSEVGKCRASLSSLRDQLRDNWAGMTEEVQSLESRREGKKIVMINPDWLESEWRLCDKDWSRFREGWHECRGTWPGKRGFTCGLWNMFHFLAAQTTDEAALSDLQKVRNAIGHFFDCEECRDHFMQVPVPEGAIKTRRDAQLWWWNAHNVVNRRVGKLEAAYQDGDPAFPKVQWPSEAECPTCRSKPAAHANARLRLRGNTAESVNALGTVSAAPPQAVSLQQGEAPDVPVESVTLAEALEREHWDLDQVVVFLEARYRSAAALF